MLDRNMLVRPAPIVILLALVSLLLYWPTVVSLYQAWTNPNNPTYSHGLLVVAISAVLFYRLWRKAPVAELQPSAWGILALAVMSFVWLLAHLGQVLIVQQLSLLAVIGLSLCAVLGYRNAKKLAFPVLLLLFTIPFWEFLSSSLQHLTANLVAVLLNNTGFTAALEGVLILVPAGTFEVSMDCSGLAQFIVAMMVAALYSHLNELGPRKALLMTGIAMLVAIATNMLRIYIVVVAGQLTAMQHSFVRHHWNLGWVLFGVAIFVFLLWANRYLAPEAKTVSKPEQHSLTGRRVPSRSGSPSAVMAFRTGVLALVALAVGPVLAHVYAAQDRSIAAPSLAIPTQIGPWRATGTPPDHYRPLFHGADIEYDTLYRAVGGANVYLYVAYYVRQEQNKEAVYYANRVYDGRFWKSAGSRTREIRGTLSRSLRVKETRVQSGNGGEKIVWQWYYVNGSRTSNDYMAKILNVLGTLQYDPRIAAIVIAADTNGDEKRARSVLTRFVNDALEDLEEGIDATQSM
jgi:exosortase A